MCGAVAARGIVAWGPSSRRLEIALNPTMRFRLDRGASIGMPEHGSSPNREADIDGGPEPGAIIPKSPQFFARHSQSLLGQFALS
jgi:hypothetical protein